MATSRALYVEVAGLIDVDRIYATQNQPTAAETVRALAVGIADILAADNPRFDRGRFMKACGFSPSDQADVRRRVTGRDFQAA